MVWLFPWTHLSLTSPLAHHDPKSCRSKGQCGVPGKGGGQQPQPRSWRDGTEPQLWVNQAAESHGRVRSRLSPMLSGISSCHHGAKEPSPRSNLAGRGREGMRELLMGGKFRVALFQST